MCLHDAGQMALTSPRNLKNAHQQGICHGIWTNPETIIMDEE